MKARLVRFLLALIVLGLAAYGVFTVYLDNGLRSELMTQGTKRVGTRVEDALFFGAFDPRDKVTPKIEIALKPIARGLTQPTDIGFLPPPLDEMVVTERSGRLTRVDVKSGALARWLDVDVEHGGPEQGLLGLAIHPGFAKNGRLFLNYTVTEGDKTLSVISEYRVPDPAQSLEETPFFVRHVMRLEQPFANHNGGCTRFGPDGMLYVGWGDGGSGGDPKGHGQNGKTWLGSILRIDVEGAVDTPAGQPSQAYRVPADNPFLAHDDVAPETFVIGVRNPWRFSWDEQGRMIVADVGQDDWEEVGFALPGDNLGWNIVEGYACFNSHECDTDKLREPFLVYPRSEGASVIGGFVSLAPEPAALRGMYVYGDYVSGRLWAVTLPKDVMEAAKEPSRLGAWPIHPSTFGRDKSGRLYVADHSRGVIYRLDDKPR